MKRSTILGLTLVAVVIATPFASAAINNTDVATGVTTVVQAITDVSTFVVDKAVDVAVSIQQAYTEANPVETVLPTGV